MKRSILRHAPIALVVITAGIGIAQSATTGRVFPYVGYLEENGFPVDGERDLRLNLYASAGAGTACETQYFDAVTVANGRFKVDVEDVPDACLIGGELYAGVSVGPVGGTLTDLSTGEGTGRVMIGAVPFAAASPKAATLLVESHADIGGDLAVAGDIDVSGGLISKGGTPNTNGSDLGLYSQVSGGWVRVVTNNAPVKFFSDSGYGTTANLTVEADGQLTTRGKVNLGDASGAGRMGTDADDGVVIFADSDNTAGDTSPAFRVVSNSSYFGGNQRSSFFVRQDGDTTVQGDLTVNGSVLGAYNTAFNFNTDYTASSDGFVVATVFADNNGDRGYVNGQVNGTSRAQDSVHYFTGSDVVVRDGSITMPVRRGDTWRVNNGSSSGTCAFSLAFVPLGVP